jgi:hypothetical protein
MALISARSSLSLAAFQRRKVQVVQKTVVHLRLEFIETLAALGLLVGFGKRLAVVARLLHGLAAIGQEGLDLDAEAFGQLLDPALARQVHATGGAVHDVLDLLQRQVLGAQRLDETHRVLGRPQVQLQRGKEDVGAVQHRLAPDHQRARHLHDDDVETLLRQVEDRVDSLAPMMSSGTISGGAVKTDSLSP